MTLAPSAPEAEHESGFGIVPKYLRGRLTSHEIAVFVALSWRADRAGTCWLRHARLAAEAGCSVSTVQRALRSMREKGLVSWRPKEGLSGDVVCNIYTLHIWHGTSNAQSGRPFPPVTPTDPLGQADRQNKTPGTTPLEHSAPTERGHRTATDRVPIDVVRAVNDDDLDAVVSFIEQELGRPITEAEERTVSGRIAEVVEGGERGMVRRIINHLRAGAP